MLTRTTDTVDDDLYDKLTSQHIDVDFKLAINEPTGDFFYDPWVIKDEFKNTIWDELYNSLPTNKGEARLIKLEPGNGYLAHSDMDNRWHFNIQGKQSYLIDLDHNVMHQVKQDQYWYYMNAGVYHTAANFGNIDRIQLVVRELFKHRTLYSPSLVKIKLKEYTPDYRYEFDRVISPWLNKVNTLGCINNFKYVNEEVEFEIENALIPDLKAMLPKQFEIV
jgi:hypothetical protein